MTSGISRSAGAQSFGGAHRSRVCVCLFLGVSVHACCERLRKITETVLLGPIQDKLRACLAQLHAIPDLKTKLHSNFFSLTYIVLCVHVLIRLGSVIVKSVVLLFSTIVL
jgi:hypothetical protein